MPHTVPSLDARVRAMRASRARRCDGLPEWSSGGRAVRVSPDEPLKWKVRPSISERSRLYIRLHDHDPHMTAILEDLAAGRIDAAEAARRIDALKAAEQAAATRAGAGAHQQPSRPTRSWPRAATGAPIRGRRAPTGRSTPRTPPRASPRREPDRPSRSRRRAGTAKPVNTSGVERDLRTRGRSPGADRRRDLGRHAVRRRAARAAPQRLGARGLQRRRARGLARRLQHPAQGAAQPGRLPRARSRQGAVPAGQPRTSWSTSR